MSLVELETPVLADPRIRSWNLLIEPTVTAFLTDAVQALNLERIAFFSHCASKAEKADEKCVLTIGKGSLWLS